MDINITDSISVSRNSSMVSRETYNEVLLTDSSQEESKSPTSFNFSRRMSSNIFKKKISNINNSDLNISNIEISEEL